jgi:hypothetical protein
LTPTYRKYMLRLESGGGSITIPHLVSLELRLTNFLSGFVIRFDIALIELKPGAHRQRLAHQGRHLFPVPTALPTH